jgi:hypothetical protein
MIRISRSRGHLWLELALLFATACDDRQPEPSKPAAPTAAVPPSAAGAVAQSAPSNPRGPLAFADLQSYLPAKLGEMTRTNVTPIPAVGTIAARYEDADAIADVNLGMVTDVASSRSFYESGYRDRATVANATVFMRAWTEDNGRSTAEACVILADRVNACVGLSPGKGREALPVLEQLDLAALAEHAAMQ